MPVLWSFRHYIKPDGFDEIRAWYDAQSKASQAKICSRFRFLAQTPHTAWPEKVWKPLKGKACAPLGEVRLFLDHIQHRPLTYFSHGMTMTFVICAIEKGSKLVPKDACQIGKRRRAEVEADASRCKPSDIPLQ